MENNELEFYPLEKEHDWSSFDCGSESLNLYLKKYALQNHRNGSSKAYVLLRENQIIAYYTLSFGSVSPEEAPVRVSKGLAKYPIPIMLLGRLAVANTEKGKGLGRSLLIDAFLKTIQASDIAGLRALSVHAKDKQVKQFYMKFGFYSSPVDEFRLFLLLKDLKQFFKNTD